MIQIGVSNTEGTPDNKEGRLMARGKEVRDVSVPIRDTQTQVDRMDAAIAGGKAASRSDYVRRAVSNQLKKDGY